MNLLMRNRSTVHIEKVSPDIDSMDDCDTKFTALEPCST
jgi:hypothetical protein